METEQLIGLYHTGFIVCLILTILFVALSVLLFFKLRIRDVFNFMTGRAEKMTIRRMEEENAKTGKLRQEYLNPATSSDLYTTPSGNIPPIIYPPTEPTNTGTEKTEPTLRNAEGSSRTDLLKPENDGSEATTLLRGEGSEETTLLNQGEGSEETTLLKHETDAAAEVEEAAFAHQETSPQTGTAGETTLLTPDMEAAFRAQQEAAKTEEKPRWKFDIIKENMWIHTDEVI